MGMRPYVVGPGEAVPGSGQGVKASGASTAGSLTLIEQTIMGGPPLHAHAREDESFFILDGRLSVSCGGEELEAGPRSFVFLPRGLPHTFDSGGSPARLLLIATPGGLDRYFAELSSAIAGGAEGARLAEIRDRHGITLA
jgi:mannose-6-phosphate isomerase-like protein (cupin superfamily)